MIWDIVDRIAEPLAAIWFVLQFWFLVEWLFHKLGIM